ncbi:MAG: hypothetical protein ACKODH_08405 [Limisphaerales bacterium]
MNLILVTYAFYLLVSVALTVWVAKTLHKNGRIFLVDSFGGNEPLADSVNHLLVVGFYLMNIGYVTLALKYGVEIANAREAVETFSTKIGMVLMVLGIMHFFNLLVFSRMRRRLAAQGPAACPARRDAQAGEPLRLNAGAVRRPGPPAMNILHVLYDSACPVSVRQQEWLARQEAIGPLRFLPHRAEEVGRRFPGIEPHLTLHEFTVVSDDGRFWTGPSAVVTCLFALEAHRELAERLAHPALLPVARTALELLSREVFEMNCLLRRSPVAELEQILRLNSDVVRKHFRVPPPVPVG